MPVQLNRLHRVCCHLRKQVQLSGSLLATLEDGMQQRRAVCANWMRELRRMSRELSAITASMKAQAVLLPLPSAEDTLFDFVNEDEVKVKGGRGCSFCLRARVVCDVPVAGCSRHCGARDAAAEVS